ncbi:MAG: molybdopterin-dependent oxidoreductase [Bacillota bacterium]|nr:molybdopterin-dependent oxidoreductase [Bacillota bacterium]MDI7249113.1 molybdopterin-dependent oxidoreductase [Bacillota bacterium]
MKGYSVVGKPLPRYDGVLQVTGRATYGIDLSRPGMLHARMLRSPWPHARIVGVDVSAALRVPGVRAVVTAADVPYNRFGFTHLDQPVLAEDKVRYRGDAVAAVAATTLDEAEEALEAIRVEYEPLPAVFDPVEALEPQAPKVHGESNIAERINIQFGDVERGWADSDEIIEETFRTQMVEHCHLEPHAGLAEVDERGVITVHSSVQRPFLIAADLSKILRVPMNRVRVVVTAVGGGFGGKNEITFEPVLALLALKTGRPVKMVYSREEEFRATTVRHPYILQYRSGVKRDGTLVARHVKITSDCGAYVSWGAWTLSKAAIHAAGPYVIPNVRIEGLLVYTNNNVGGAMRGFGVPQVAFAYESHTDTLAAALGMDPVEFRLKNLLRDGGTLPTGQVLDRVTLLDTMKAAVDMAGWKEAIRWR